MSRRRNISRTGALGTILGLICVCLVGIVTAIKSNFPGWGTIPEEVTSTAISQPIPTEFVPGLETPGVSPAPDGSWWEVYFTDWVTTNNPAQWQNSIEGKLIEKINVAQNSVHIAAFEFDLTPVAEALIAARGRGVDVRWVTDDEYGIQADAEPGRGQFAMLQNAGIEVRADNRSALMHNKFIIFDGQILWTGSTNLTKNAVFKQDNNVIVIHSSELAAIYENEFQEMWNGQFGRNSPSQILHQSISVNGTPVTVVFTPEDGAIEQAIIPTVTAAQTEIRFLAFSFTDYPLASAMIQRRQSGVDVSGVYETVGSDTDAAEFKTFVCAGVPVRRDGNSSFMHNKVIVVDRRFVITGSLNYSTNAEVNNDENVIILDNSEIAGRYLQDFDRVWSQAVDPPPGTVICQ